MSTLSSESTESTKSSAIVENRKRNPPLVGHVKNVLFFCKSQVNSGNSANSAYSEFSEYRELRGYKEKEEESLVERPSAVCALYNYGSKYVLVCRHSGNKVTTSLIKLYNIQYVSKSFRV